MKQLEAQGLLNLKTDNELFYSKKADLQIGFSDVVATSLSWILIAITFPFSLFFCIKIVTEYKRMVVYRLGKVPNRSPKGPGVVLILPCIDDYQTVDLRTMSYDVPSQETMTRDSVTVSVDAAVYYRTSDPVASLSAISDAHFSTKQLAQTTLRNVIGTRSLSELMSERDGIAKQAKLLLDTATHRCLATASWGITVERVEIKDIRLPRELCRTMAAEAEAARESDAKVVCAQGELNASVALLRAAEELQRSPTAIQLRIIHSLVKIASVNNHTIVLPIPIELVRSIFKKINK